MITGIISILGGVIAASSYIVSKKSNAQELINKLTPYQGWIGVVLLFWSIKNVFRLLNYFNSITLLFVVAQFVVGFLLAFSLLSEYLFSKNDEVKEKGQKLRSTLIKYQIPAGIGLIVLGIMRLFHWI